MLKKKDKIIGYISKLSTTKSIYVVISVFILLLLLNSFSLFSLGKVVDVRVEEAKILAEPAEIELITIQADCDDCFDVSSAVENLKQGNVNVNEDRTLTINSQEAQELISKYEIEKLPTFLVFGEIDKINSNNLEKRNDALIFAKVFPPYYEKSLNRVVGRVNLINIVDSDCIQCISLEPILGALGESGVSVDEIKRVEYNSVEGRELISDFSIKQTPALLISKEIDYYPEISQQLNQLGAVEKGDYYGVHSTSPPYRDIATGEIMGLVELIMITDDSCVECYDVNTNKRILASLGILVDTEKVYDIGSVQGKQFISKYGISKVPMIIVSPEAKEYPLFVQSWGGVGDKEDDGWFVMRSPEILGPVKDISNGQIITGESS